MTDQPIVTYMGPLVFVRDIKAAARFYTQVLGLEIETDFGENVALRGGLALWELGPERIIRQRGGVAPPYGVPFHLAMGYRRSAGVRTGWSLEGHGLRVQPMRKVLESAKR